MDLSGLTIGYGITGSFCTLEKTKNAIAKLIVLGAKVIPVFSYNVLNTDTRFGSAEEFRADIGNLTGNCGIFTIPQAEPVGPQKLFDVMVIAPCTGNTAAKLCNGITDTPVLMAAKAHMRNQRPLVIALASNDALGINFKTVGNLMNMKNIYFVPFGQDDYVSKPNSLVCDMEKIPDTITMALNKKQIQPVLL
ncbi:MAG: dipicolinate synthase subunit B [Agathobacter sp.]|nr:dipicolinate synthase subunit B [Agathobacter sp.]